MKSGFILLTAISLLATGCGMEPQGASKRNQGGESGDADLTRAVTCGPAAPALTGYMAQDTAPSAQVRHVPAEDVFLTVGSTEESLCEILRESGKTLMIMQFASTKCYNCLKWIDVLDTALNAAGVTDVVMVAAVTDDQETLSAAEMRSLRDDIAPGAVFGRDNGTLWSFFGPTEGTLTIEPTALIMDQLARGYIVRDDQKDLASILEEANTLLGTAVTVP